MQVQGQESPLIKVRQGEEQSGGLQGRMGMASTPTSWLSGQTLCDEGITGWSGILVTLTAAI